MSDTRYAPPAAAVADLESGDVSLERPRIVAWATGLISLDIALGIPGLVSSFLAAPDQGAEMLWFRLGTALAAAMFTALAAFLIYKAWKGRNWGRIVLLVLFVLTLAMTVFGLAVTYMLLKERVWQSWGEFGWTNALYVGQTLIETVAMCLLFSPGANAWYRALRAARTT